MLRNLRAIFLVGCLAVASVTARPIFFGHSATAASGGTGDITAVNLLNSVATTTDATSFTSGSFTPTANALIVIVSAATHASNTDPGAATISDSVGTLTWTQVSDVQYTSNTVRGRNAVYATRAPASPGSMTVTATYSAPGSNSSGCAIIVFEIIGSDVANGVGQCFVQVVTTPGNDTGTTASLTLGSASNSHNRTFMVASHYGNENNTPAANFTEIGDVGYTSPQLSTAVEWRSDQFDTAPSYSWPSSTIYGAVAFEVKSQ